MTTNPLFWKLNKANPDNGAAGEKHGPVITVEGEIAAGNTVKVTVDVGEGKHPNQPDHFIEWAELRANDLCIGRVEFSAGITAPIATFTVNIPHEGEVVLTALEKCNLHGIWISEPVNLF